MNVRPLNIHDLTRVAALEEKTYPPEICLGYYDYRNDFECYDSYSLGVFKGGRLIGYVICFKQDDDTYYISDLVCRNPKALLSLLSVFAFQMDRKKLYAELRESSYKLLMNKRSIIEIQEDYMMENYYAKGEHAHEVIFSINAKKIEDIKYHILSVIYSSTETLNYTNVVLKLYQERCLYLKDILPYKDFINMHINTHNNEVLRIAI